LPNSSSSNRFDATQGRRRRCQVNVITSRDQSALGLFRGNFATAFQLAKSRIGANGKWKPINNQHTAGVGGPLRDKLHFFANYEYEQEPRTSIWPRVPFSTSRWRTTTEIGGGPGLSALVANAAMARSAGAGCGAVRSPRLRTTRVHQSTKNTTTNLGSSRSAEHRRSTNQSRKNAFGLQRESHRVDH